MSRILQYLNPFDAESRARRADQRARTEEYGFPFAMTPMEQAEIAGQRARNAAPDIGPPTADAGAKQEIALNTAEGVLKQGSQGGAMDIDAMRKGFDPSNAESVRQMQRMLNQAGFTSADGSPLAEDGVFGRKTEAALRRMQGGYRPDNASIASLTENPNAKGSVNTRGKKYLASREGRDDSVVPTPAPGFAGPFMQTEPEYNINSKERENFVGGIRGGAKSIDDAIERVAPFIGNSSAYRGAKEGIKKFFSGLGDADY